MRVFLPVCFMLFFTCASRNEPEWLKTQPQSLGYWFGIGIVQKHMYANDCREEAQNKALAEIASQISVDITATFERVVKEHNLDLDEFSKSVIKTRISKNLPNVQYVDFHDSKEKCGLLARLSKSSYYESIELQRRNAIQSALGLLVQAESNFNVQTFSYLNEAISEIIPYLEIPIEEEYPSGSGKIVNLYSYIKILANRSINRLGLIPSEENLEIKLGFTRDVQLSVRVIDKVNNSPIENIPVLCYLENKMQFTSALSNTEGACIFSIPTITNKNSIQYINYTVNEGEILQNREYFGSLPPINAQSTLTVNPPQININIIENNLGEPLANPYIEPVVSEFFSRHYLANFIQTDDADLLIGGTINTRALSDTPNDYGIFQVFADMTIDITNGVTGEEILRKSFNNVQGSDFHSNKEAANQSLRKMSEKIIEDFLPEVIEVMKDL